MKSINVSFENLTELTVQGKGFPNVIEGSFNCGGNELTSLQGAPKDRVGGDFDCSYNRLTSLEGAPGIVGGHFYCRGNSKKFTEAEVRAVCEVAGDVIV